MKIKNNNKTTKKNIKNEKLGGKIIGSGGYGCIFKPVLKCKGKKRENNKISKLMVTKNAKTEYDDIVRFLPYLKRIPDYDKYFLVYDITICKPDKLDEEDLEDFDSKCKPLIKRKINSKNINEERKLKLLSTVNMPYGGMDVGEYIEKEMTGEMASEKLILLNNQMMKLLKNGIIPMNDENIYHCDLKDSNILVDSEMNTRLIDWGISCKYDNGNVVPSILQNRPFQYNIPFSNILFNEIFEKLYKEFLTEKKAPSFLDTRDFVINYVFKWIDLRGPGHLKSMNAIIKLLFEKGIINIDEEFKDQLIEFDYTFYFIFEYITKILMKFTIDGKFDKITYLKIFLKNIDIWGFGMSFIAIAELIHENFHIDEDGMKIISTIKDIIVLLFESATIEIDINKLIHILESLNILFKEYSFSNNKSKIDKEKTSSISSSSSSSSKKSTHKISSREKSSSNNNFSRNTRNTRKLKRYSFIKSLYRKRQKQKQRQRQRQNK
jgi:serine/threonine protein kinase